MANSQTVETRYLLSEGITNINMVRGSTIRTCVFVKGTYHLIVDSPCCTPVPKSIRRAFVVVRSDAQRVALLENPEVSLTGVHHGIQDFVGGIIGTVFELKTDPNAIMTLG